MIAIVKPTNSQSQAPDWQAGFLKMLPYISRFARITFRKLRPDLREELVQEAIANAFAAYARLVERGRTDKAYGSALARYAVAQVRVGRRVGNRRNSRDVLSGFAQYTKGFHVERLHQYGPAGKGWQEMVVEDKTASPAEIACCRIDFAAWLGLLTRRYRKIALTLAAGETTQDTAKKFGLCSARISQIRLLPKESWECFQGDAVSKPQLAAA